MVSGVYVAIIIAVIIVLVAYVVTIFVMYEKKTFIFEPYVPVIPSNACQPLISVRPLTQEQIDARNLILLQANPPPQ